MSHSSVRNYLHIIFATRGRDSLIAPEIENDLYAYLVAIANKKKVIIQKINGVDDHIHMLVILHPAVALATLMKELKSYSTGWMKRKGYPQFSWQEGYGGFSCSKSHVENVVKYIARQKEHHKKHSFEAEVNELNEKWGTTWLRD